MKTVTNYLEYEAVTKIKLINENPSPFPAISICNLAPFDRFYSGKYVEQIAKNLRDNFTLKSNPNAYRYYYMSNLHEMIQNDLERIIANFSPNLLSANHDAVASSKKIENSNKPKKLKENFQADIIALGASTGGTEA